jgi:hypothetical protein
VAPASDPQHGARSVAAPQGDRLAVRLGGRGEQEPGVAPRGAAGDAVGLDQRDRRAALGERPRQRDTGDAPADDRDLGIALALERRELGSGLAPPDGVGNTHEPALWDRSPRAARNT